MTDAISGELEQFLRLHVEGFDELNVLLALSAEPRAWTVASLAQSLHIAPAAAEAALRQLATRALVAGPSTVDGTFRCAPASQTTRLMLEALARAHREQPLVLTNAMNKQAVDRLRRAMLRTFADGFRWRGPGNA